MDTKDSQPGLGDQFASAIAARRQQLERKLEEILSRAHTPLPSDAGDLAELIERLGLDPAEVQRQISRHVEQHKQQQVVSAKRDSLTNLSAEVQRRQKWADAFSGVPDFAELLTGFGDAIAARSFGDPYIFPNVTRQGWTAPYLRSRGWRLASMQPEEWRRDGSTTWIASFAIKQQFGEDLSPLRAALASYTRPTGMPALPPQDAELDAAIQGEESALANLPEIDPLQERLVIIALAGIAAFMGETSPDEVGTARATLRRELPRIEAEAKARLQRSASEAHLAAMAATA